MTARTILLFQCGHAGAIRAVASARSALWVGLGLVLLTACARSYDQSYLAAAPGRWLLGPLGFSLVSGTWLFVIGYWGCARHRFAKEDLARPGFPNAWRGFMGAYWMTAPIAWLYALPVERWYDSLGAARANLWLLGIVSLWRVLLMARVFQVVCQAPYARALLWVLLPASVEVLALYIFGPAGLSQAIMAGMGGMRNSPEEQLLLNALATAATLAFWCVPLAFGLLVIWRWPGPARPFPERQPARMPWAFLGVLTVAWIAVTVPAQRQLRLNHAVESALAQHEIRQALEVMKAHQPEDFAPARPLPPKAYEWRSTDELGAMMGQLRSDDPEWIHQHCQRRLAAVIHAGMDRSQHWDLVSPLSVAQLRWQWRIGTDAEAWLGILHGLEQSASGRAWRDRQPVLWSALLAECLENHSKQEADEWGNLTKLLQDRGVFPLEDGPVKANHPSP